MIDIRYYLSQNTVDGHIHLFDKDGCILYSKDSKYVTFCDIEPKYIDDYKSTMKYYEKFIDNDHNENMILLATSPSEDEMIALHKKWPNIIKGFGEVKCYKEWKGEVLNLDKLGKYYKLFKYAGENNLPIYIHFSLYDDACVTRFESVLKKFPSTKIVLCHCGMDIGTDNDFCYHSVSALMKTYHNLWCDISWKATDYFIKNPLRILNLNTSHLIIGSDINKFNCSEDSVRHIWNKLHKFDGFIKSDRNIKKLFNI